MAPKKRNGTNADHQPSREEVQERIDFAAHLLARRLVKSDIKRMIRLKYKCDARTCERYLSRARAVLIEWSGKTKEQHRIDSHMLYETIIQKEKDPRLRMLAQERIDKLFGLEVPEPPRPRGGDLEPEEMTAHEISLRLRRKREEDRQRAADGAGTTPPAAGEQAS